MSDEEDLGIPEFLRRGPGYKQSEWTPPVQRPSKEAAPTSAPVNKHAKRSRAEALTSVALAEAEGMLDDAFFSNEEASSMYDKLAQRDSPPSVARALSERFSAYLSELRELKPGCDPQLREGYSNYSRAEINRLVSIVETIVADADRYATNSRAARAVVIRRPRQANAAKQVKSLRFLREHAELKLVSVDPVKVVGASLVLLYDTKRRLLSLLVSNSRTGFEVRGTSVRKIDNEASVCKVLRKPEDVLARVLEAKRADAIKSVVEQVKTKGVVPTGRTNEQTVILKVL